MTRQRCIVPGCAVAASPKTKAPDGVSPPIPDIICCGSCMQTRELLNSGSTAAAAQLLLETVYSRDLIRRPGLTLDALKARRVEYLERTGPKIIEHESAKKFRYGYLFMPPPLGLGRGGMLQNGAFRSLVMSMPWLANVVPGAWDPAHKLQLAAHGQCVYNRMIICYG